MARPSSPVIACKRIKAGETDGQRLAVDGWRRQILRRRRRTKTEPDLNQALSNYAWINWAASTAASYVTRPPRRIPVSRSPVKTRMMICRLKKSSRSKSCAHHAFRSFIPLLMNVLEWALIWDPRLCASIESLENGARLPFALSEDGSTLEGSLPD